MSTEKKKEMCVGRIYGDWGMSRICGKTASLEHEGEHFCKLHHPPTVKEKRDKRNADFQLAWQQKQAAMRAAEDERKEKDRKAAAYGGLLEALELIANTGMDARQCMETARAAIARATGGQS